MKYLLSLKTVPIVQEVDLSKECLDNIFNEKNAFYLYQIDAQEKLFSYEEFRFATAKLFGSWTLKVELFGGWCVKIPFQELYLATVAKSTFEVLRGRSPGNKIVKILQSPDHIALINWSEKIIRVEYE